MPWQFPDTSPDPTSFSRLAPEFLLHARLELGFSVETVAKYGECLKHVWRFWGDRAMSGYGSADLLRLREWFESKKLSVSRQTSLLLALRKFLLYCRVARQTETGIDPEAIIAPRRPRRDVVFLTPDEVDRFVGSIQLSTSSGQPHPMGLRFRALVEVLLGSAMRISEVLSLERASIDFDRREAKIVGKGNKERVVFFTDRALEWLKKYVAIRTDDCPALFVCESGKRRLKRDDLWRYFDRHRRLARIHKRVTPHILRHTAATQLLLNGCPIGHIKEILGHERLETTCRYYLGLDRRAAKEAHRRFMIFN